MTDEQIARLARTLRIDSLRMINKGRSAHIGSNLSLAEILAVLYGRILNVAPETVEDPNRDRLVLSKGHAAAIYYAVLAERGFFPKEWLDDFYVDGGRLAGHATWGIPGIEVSSGALGHGLPMASGMALAAKRDGKTYRVFAVLSDGECDEGSTWEAAMLSAHLRLDNLIAVVDYNKIQALGHTRVVNDLEPFPDKWRAFGWGVRETDGHDVVALSNALTDLPFRSGAPSCLIAHTVKGKGVSFMEDQLLWHYRTPQDEEFELAMFELEKGS